MKKIFTLLIFVMGMMASNALADELVRYQSTQNGLQLLFPGEADIDTDDEHKLVLEGDDYLFTAFYFDPESNDEDTLSESYTQFLASSGFDVSKAKKSDFESKTLVGVMYITTSDDDMLSVSGIIYSKQHPDDAGFLFNMVSDPDNKNLVVKCIKSMEFNPEAIED